MGAGLLASGEKGQHGREDKGSHRGSTQVLCNLGAWNCSRVLRKKALIGALGALLVRQLGDNSIVP